MLHSPCLSLKEHLVILPKAHGHINFHDDRTIKNLGRREARAEPGESGQYWWLFTGEVTDEQLESWMQMNKIEHEPISSPYDCTGLTGRRRPVIRRTKTRVLVTQMWSIDI